MSLLHPSASSVSQDASAPGEVLLGPPAPHGPSAPGGCCPPRGAVQTGPNGGSPGQRWSRDCSLCRGQRGSVPCPSPAPTLPPGPSVADHHPCCRVTTFKRGGSRWLGRKGKEGKAGATATAPQRWAQRAVLSMDPRGGRGWICLAVLCSGAALVLIGEDQGGQSLTQPDSVLWPGGTRNSSARAGGGPVAWTSVPPWDRTPGPSALPTKAGAAGNKSHNASAIPIRYWSPVIFVALALLVLFLTYRRTRGEESNDQAASVSDDSDLGAPANIPVRDTAPIIPPAKEEQKGLEKPPTWDSSEPDAPLPQPLPPQALEHVPKPWQDGTQHGTRLCTTRPCVTWEKQGKVAAGRRQPATWILLSRDKLFI
ncbi:uncharacterized protein [Struthio camelus]|uniref:uncharacterized protein isoform X2 n=1 Tax=Struthio camelus TaxID=8801 RepID=UPI0036040D94